MNLSLPLLASPPSPSAPSPGVIETAAVAGADRAREREGEKLQEARTHCQELDEGPERSALRWLVGKEPKEAVMGARGTPCGSPSPRRTWPWRTTTRCIEVERFLACEKLYENNSEAIYVALIC
uniref:Uncharacterized protein n=1 Tax=Oryza punctata TaxID=4537 RepID=A0A0E0M2B1_ORYPU